MVKPITYGTLGDQSTHMIEFKTPLSIHIDTSSVHGDRENIYIQIEPNEILNHDWVTKNYNKFKYILCWEENLLSLPNSVLFPFGTCWVNGDREYKKYFGVSNICSSKTMLEGHRIRQMVFEAIDKSQVRKMNIRSPPRIESKEILFDGFQYSVAIENISKNNWFTEKLIDCLSSETIPIYYGCPNIGDFFDDSYFLKFNTIDQFNSIISNLNPLHYEKNIIKIKNNKEVSKKYYNLWVRLNNLLRNYYE